MSSTLKETSKPSVESCLNKLYADLFHLVSSVEKSSGSELTLRLRNVEADITTFKDLIKNIPDIGIEEDKQRKKIAALYKQIEQKDELIQSLAAFSLDDYLNQPAAKSSRESRNGSEDK
ncbi:unnamed protein product [Caenorhabditis sp. 36 PRJEB53466]|nr:unnamed protein product [Caenorhabditis sp. 36 PRJEB53466]